MTREFSGTRKARKYWRFVLLPLMKKIPISPNIIPGVIAGSLISIDYKRAEQIPRYSDGYSAVRLLIILKRKAFLACIYSFKPISF